MDMTGLCVLEARSAIATRRLKVRDYASGLLAQMHRWRHINAIVACDEGALLAAADRCDRVANIAADRPLFGLPFVAKDNIDTVDLPTSACTPALRGHHPPRNSPLIDRLIDAGALLLGKTNMHELAFGVTNNGGAFGAARNPCDPRLIPGGSSGGTAAAIAARIAPFGLGSDTGGSVRIPAALCGVVGFRPSHGRYPREGVVPISITRDTVGPMARTVADVALVDAILAGAKTCVAPVDLRSLRLGVPRRYFHEDLEPPVAAAMESFLHRATTQGAQLVEADIPDIGELNESVSFTIVGFEAHRALEHYLADSAPGITVHRVLESIATPSVKAFYSTLTRSSAVSQAAYRRALDVHRPALQAAIHTYLDRHRLDAYIIPTCCMTAPPVGEDETVEHNGRRVPTFSALIRNCEPSSNAGTPSISIPIGASAASLPIGAMIETRAGQDQRLLSIASRLSQICAPLPPPRPAGQGRENLLRAEIPSDEARDSFPRRHID